MVKFDGNCDLWIEFDFIGLFLKAGRFLNDFYCSGVRAEFAFRLDNGAEAALAYFLGEDVLFQIIFLLDLEKWIPINFHSSMNFLWAEDDIFQKTHSLFLLAGRNLNFLLNWILSLEDIDGCGVNDGLYFVELCLEKRLRNRLCNQGFWIIFFLVKDFCLWLWCCLDNGLWRRFNFFFYVSHSSIICSINPKYIPALTLNRIHLLAEYCPLTLYINGNKTSSIF